MLVLPENHEQVQRLDGNYAATLNDVGSFWTHRETFLHLADVLHNHMNMMDEGVKHFSLKIVRISVCVIFLVADFYIVLLK